MACDAVSNSNKVFHHVGCLIRADMFRSQMELHSSPSLVVCYNITHYERISTLIN